MLGRRVAVLMGRSSPPPKEAELWVVASLTIDAASLGDLGAGFGDKDAFLGSGELTGGLEKTLLSVPWIFEIANSRSMSLTSIVVSRCSTVASGSAMLAIKLSIWNGADVETSCNGRLSSLALLGFSNSGNESILGLCWPLSLGWTSPISSPSSISSTLVLQNLISSLRRRHWIGDIL